MKQETLGCLTLKMKKFLEMSQKERSNNFSDNYQSKLIGRIIKNIEYSFSDLELVFKHLPDNQVKKIDIEKIHNHILNSLIEGIKNPLLKKYTEKQFEEYNLLIGLIFNENVVWDNK